MILATLNEILNNAGISQILIYSCFTSFTLIANVIFYREYKIDVLQFYSISLTNLDKISFLKEDFINIKNTEIKSMIKSIEIYNDVSTDIKTRKYLLSLLLKENETFYYRFAIVVKTILSALILGVLGNFATDCLKDGFTKTLESYLKIFTKK
jgi:hypothetical protein